MSHWSNQQSKKERTFSHPIFFTNQANNNLLVKEKILDALLKKSRILSVPNLYLDELPVESKLLKDQITYLNVSFNSLTAIPCTVYFMCNLETLDLKFNFISFISQKIKNLSKLRVLELKNNKLLYLPAELKQLKNLEIVNFGENCFYDFEAVESLNKDVIINKLPTLANIALKKIHEHDDDKKCERKFCSICNAFGEMNAIYNIETFRGENVTFKYLICSEKCMVKIPICK